MTRSDPNLWQIPTWHPDWDGDFTFAGLRTFAEALLAGTDLDARLTIIEEGTRVSTCSVVRFELVWCM